MSFFLLYFESVNGNSKNFSDFSKVGKFHLPENMVNGQIKIIFDNKEYMADLISDESNICANGFFLEKDDKLKSQLIDFINQRLHNDCIIPHLGGYIETNSSETPIYINTDSIPIANAADIFQRDKLHFNQSYSFFKAPNSR